MPFWRLVGILKEDIMTDSDSNKFEDSTPVVEPLVTPHYNKNFCKYCGKELQPEAAFCSSCGKSQGKASIQQPVVQIMKQPVVQPYIATPYQQPQPVVAPNVSTTVIVEGTHSNGLGTAGFIIALLGLIFCWVPVVDVILWLLGFVFSIIGMFKAPRGMAIAGLILSLIIIIIILIFASAIYGTLETFFNK